MPTCQETFQQWLDQGYIPYRGWGPEHTGQRDTAAAQGLAGGSGPFAPANPFYEPDISARQSRWDVSNEQDILNYLEFANRLGTHTEGSLERLGVPEYTSQDIYDFFIRPDERRRIEGARESARRGVERGGRLLASEASRVGRSMSGGAPGVVAQAAEAGAEGGGLNAEATLAKATKNMARAVESGPRDPFSPRLLAASERGIAENMSVAGGLTGLGEALQSGGNQAVASGNPIGAAIGGAVATAGLPFKIGGEDQQTKYASRLADVRERLSPEANYARWSERIATPTFSQVASAPSGGLEQTLGNVYRKPEEDSLGFMFG